MVAVCHRQAIDIGVSGLQSSQELYIPSHSSDTGWDQEPDPKRENKWVLEIATAIRHSQHASRHSSERSSSKDPRVQVAKQTDDKAADKADNVASIKDVSVGKPVC